MLLPSQLCGPAEVGVGHSRYRNLPFRVPGVESYSVRAVVEDVGWISIDLNSHSVLEELRRLEAGPICI